MIKKANAYKVISTLGLLLISAATGICAGEGMAYRELGPEAYQDIKRINDYLSFYKQHPTVLADRGDYKNGEIQVETNVETIYRVQDEVYNRYKNKGMSEDFAKRASRVGIIAEDPYVYYVRDAVTFPSGQVGLYSRAMQRNSVNGPNGVGVLPVLPDKKVVLIVNYRHATRSWEVELIRGTRERAETPENAVHRELMEETGYTVGALTRLGAMAVDSAIVNTVIPIYYGEVESLQEARPEFSEAIEGSIALGKEEISKALTEGYLETEVNGAMKKVPFRDPFLTYALYVAQAKGLI